MYVYRNLVPSHERTVQMGVRRLSPESDLTKVLAKAVRELAEPEGSTLRAVEKFVQTVYEIEVEQVGNVYKNQYTSEPFHVYCRIGIYYYTGSTGIECFWTTPSYHT